MFRSFAISLALGLALLGSFTSTASARSHAIPAPTASPTPPPENAAITAIARHEFVDWQAGVVDKARYNGAFAAELNDGLIARVSKGLSAAGALERTQWLGPYPLGSAMPPAGSTITYVYRMFCAERSVYEIIAVTPDGKIAAIEFRDKMK